MHEDIADAAAVIGIFIWGEPHEAVIIKVDAQRIHAGQQDVQSQVKLGPVDQIGPSHVPTDSKELESFACFSCKKSTLYCSRIPYEDVIFFLKI